MFRSRPMDICIQQAPAWRGFLFGVVVCGEVLLTTATSFADDTQQRLLMLQKMRATTPAYKEAAKMALLENVNQVCRALRLPETLPIKTNDLTEVLINPPFQSDSAGIFGTIATTNYHYFASQNNKLSDIARNFGTADEGRAKYLASLEAKYAMPLNKMDTNAAHKLAGRMLQKASIDVRALEHDSRVEVRAWNFGDKFVPLYWVRWLQPSMTVNPPTASPADDADTVAMVEIVEPEKLLLQMHIGKPEYITSKSLMVPDRDQLLQQTDDPRIREMWFTSEAYKNAALKIMLHEANQISRALHLPEKLPIKSSDLTEIGIETPFFSERQGRFGTICTKQYVYGANAASKFSYLNRNFRAQDKSKYLTAIKTKYAESKSRINTKAAYTLAIQFLTAASIDVAALERDCRIEIKPWDLGSQFVPLYQIRWLRGKNEEEAAYVELLEPEHLLLKLWVEKPEYIERDSLVVPNREKLLSQTNAPIKQ